MPLQKRKRCDSTLDSCKKHARIHSLTKHGNKNKNCRGNGDGKESGTGLGIENKNEVLKPLDSTVHHPVLSLYYPRVLNLRSYLLEQLPFSSKSRRKKLGSLRCPQSSTSADSPEDDIRLLADVLDSTLVGVLHESDPAVNHTRQKELAAFTQSQSRCFTNCTDVGTTSSQGEVNIHSLLSLSLPPLLFLFLSYIFFSLFELLIYLLISR